MHSFASIAKTMVSLACASVAVGCTSFSTVRSAVVSPGSSLTAQATLASPPGDAAAWFWTYECTQDCDHAIAGGDLAYAYGRGIGSRVPYSLGAGLNGTYPYVEGYMQFGTSEKRPFGVGARVGIPVSGWSEHQVYGRYDVLLKPDKRLLWNPGVMYHTGHSPNGENPGTFVGIVQGFGLQIGAGTTVFTPSVALVWGRTDRRQGFTQIGPESTVFGSVGLSVGFRRREP